MSGWTGKIQAEREGKALLAVDEGAVGNQHRMIGMVKGRPFTFSYLVTYLHVAHCGVGIRDGKMNRRPFSLLCQVMGRSMKDKENTMTSGAKHIATTDLSFIVRHCLFIKNFQKTRKLKNAVHFFISYIHVLQEICTSACIYET